MGIMDFVQVVLWAAIGWCVLGWIGVFRDGDREYDRFKRKIERARRQAEVNFERQEERYRQEALQHEKGATDWPPPLPCTVSYLPSQLEPTGDDLGDLRLNQSVPCRQSNPFLLLPFVIVV